MKNILLNIIKNNLLGDTVIPEGAVNSDNIKLHTLLSDITLFDAIMQVLEDYATCYIVTHERETLQAEIVYENAKHYLAVHNRIIMLRSQPLAI